MKKTCFTILLLSSLLLSCLFFGGCDDDIYSEMSDYFDDFTIETTEENSLEENATQEEIEISDPALEEEEAPGEEAPPDSLEEGSPHADLTDLADEEATAATNTYHYVPPVSPTSTYTAACATTALNIRKGPGTNYAVLTLLRAGDSLPYLWSEGEWRAVWTGERVGYLNGGYAYLATTSPAIEAVIRAGLDKLGTPYEWGATRLITDRGTVNPYFTGKSFDCSSFVQYCYYVGAGIKLGNYTGSQADYTVGEKITSYDDLRRGDFYFTGKGTISHVVIYLGGGFLLQTYSANGGPVSVTTDERWRGKFLSARRPDLTVTDQFG